MLDDNPPRIGLFWVATNTSGAGAVHHVAHDATEVPGRRGSRSPDYGDYPRGRVNWRERITVRFRLPEERTLTLIDRDYRSRQCPPAEA